MKVRKWYEWRIISDDGLAKRAVKGYGWAAESVTGSYETAEEAVASLEQQGWRYEDFLLIETYRLFDE